MCVRELKELGTLGGVLVLSLVIGQCELVGGGTHQETHQIIFCFWSVGVVTCGVD